MNGKNALFANTLEELAESPRMRGNPFLWPWPNRLDWDGFFFEGQEFRLNEALGNFRRDGNQQPIHGLVGLSADWEVVDLGADEASAWATSRLEFAAHPELMQQFPFAHSVEMTYRLAGGRLEVHTEVENLSHSAMPISLGYHPYFQVHDSPRDEWTVRIAARDQWVLNEKLTPTGDTQSASEAFGDPLDLALEGVSLDHVFGGLIRDNDGTARFSLAGREERVDVYFGEEYDTSVVYAPTRGTFVCFEPMAGITNALNLQHRGSYDALQSIEPGESWEASFVIHPVGF